MGTIKKTSIAIIMSLATLSLSGIIFVPSATAAPLTFTVNVNTDEVDANPGDGTCETANTGECTLRAAIEEANANAGADTIEFNIPGGGVHTITLAGQLPNLNETTTIDGYSQSGASPNTSVSPEPINSTIKIEINAENLTGTSALVLGAEDSIIKGISIYSCLDRACIDVQNVSGVKIQGNYIGTDATGINVPSLSKAGIGSRGSILVGGTNPEDRNVIGTTHEIGIGSIASEGQMDVYGNYIGIGKDGTTDLNTALGVLYAGGYDSHVGGPGVGESNLISGGEIGQVVGVFSNNLTVQGNLIGTDYTGQQNSSITSGTGIVMELATTNSLIGGDQEGQGNIVSNVTGLGISVLSSKGGAYGPGLDTTGISIIGNSISNVGIFTYPGFGDSNQGIDLAGFNADDGGSPISFYEEGVTLNSVDESGAGPNAYANFPVLKDAQQIGNQLTIHYSLDTVGSPTDQYRIEFFSNDSSTIFGYGPGQDLLGYLNSPTGENLSAVLTLPNGVNVTNKSLSATSTAIDSGTASGYGNTSEFAKNLLIGSATDFDADTVPDAIENAGPNGGDANDDGIQDSIQPTVSTFVSATSGKYTSFVTSGCSSNAQITSIAEASLGFTDAGFQYPFGLTDFVLNCSLGDTVTIDKYVFTPETDVTDFSARKYRPNTHTFEAVENSTVESETIGGQHAIHLNYSIQDGAAQDDDGVANGIIVDPVGLAEVYVGSQSVTNPSATGTLAATGAKNITVEAIIAGVLLLAGIVMIATSRKKQVKN